jgi:PKD repeat protein
MHRTLTYLSTILCIVILGLQLPAYSQSSWQWGKRGGSFAGSAGGSEEVVDIVHDRNGNTYVLAMNAIGAIPVTDGQAGSSIYDKLTLVSWNCEGNIRWIKNIGSAGPVTTCGMGIDSSGSVYVAGNIQSHNATKYGYFGSDTTLGNQKKTMYIVKYDSSGIFQWLRRPQPENFDITQGGNGIYGFIGIQVAPSGNVHLMAYCSPGAYENGAFTIASKGYYILQFNKDGLQPGATALQMATTDGGSAPNIDGQSNVYAAQFSADFRLGRYYLYGQYDKAMGNLSFGSTAINGTGGVMGYPIFLAAFGSNGNSLWSRQSSADGYAINRNCKAVCDEEGNIYIAGDASPQGGNTFNGHVFTNALVTYMPVPFVISLDTMGVNRWVSTGNSSNAIDASAIAYRNNKVWLTGSYPETLQWGSFQLHTNVGQAGGYLPYLASFDAPTGSISSIDTLVASAVYNGTTAIGVDRNNQVYIGGKFGEQLTVAGTVLSNSGGPYDWFVARYGISNCQCDLPLPDFTYDATTGAFTYTGSTPFTSISWNFGDGSAPSNQTNPTHTYTADGSYTVCVTVSNQCGSNTLCKTVTKTPISIYELKATHELSIYPNPATRTVHIRLMAEGSRVAIYNLAGKLQLQQPLTRGHNAIDIAQLASGIYIVQVSDNKGGSVRRKLIIEQ